MNLSDISSIKKLLSSQGFSFKKSLGQNFLIDSTVCPAMAEAACDENTGVLEFRVDRSRNLISVVNTKEMKIV